MPAMLRNLLQLIGYGNPDPIGASAEELLAHSSVKSGFESWCVPRRGQSNPEDLTNPVWTWLVETGLWPEAAHRAAGSGRRRKPGWNFGGRLGQSETVLDDGSSVLIGGEYEDFYDPDFYIYNDVILTCTDGSIVIYGYPQEVFQPTDFHTATKVEDCIYIIGCLGYVKDRRPSQTPIYILDLQSFQISTAETVGEAPSWLFKHTARYEPESHSIVLKGGQVIRGSANNLTPNKDLWELSLQGFKWKKL